MLRYTVPTLENEIAQRLVTAAAAAATTYIRPGRFPKWVRRGITASNTLTSVGLAMAGPRRPASTKLPAAERAKAVDVVDGQAQPRTGTNWASATSAGMAFVTSGVALRVDSTIEKTLLKRGVRHPRLVMALGAAAMSMAGPWIAKKAGELTARLEAQMPKEVLDGRLADPLGTDTPTSPHALPGRSHDDGAAR